MEAEDEAEHKLTFCLFRTLEVCSIVSGRLCSLTCLEEIIEAGSYQAASSGTSFRLTSRALTESNPLLDKSSSSSSSSLISSRSLRKIFLVFLPHHLSGLTTSSMNLIKAYLCTTFNEARDYKWSHLLAFSNESAHICKFSVRCNHKFLHLSSFYY